MTIGNKIAQRRKKLALTQEELSEKSGISLRTIQRIETNKSTARSFTLKTLATTLDLDLSEFISEDKLLDQKIITALKLINLSALTGILVPFANLIMPIVLRNRYKNDEEIYSISGKILSFQIICWLLMTVTVLISIPLQTWFINLIGLRVSLVLIVLIIFYILNISIILKNHERLLRNNSNIYPKTVNLF